MAQHEPLNDKVEISDNMKAFLQSKIGNSSRESIFVRVLTETIRPTNKDENLYDGYVRMDKFHDKEPEHIVKTLEMRYPEFFDSLPHRGDLTFGKKKCSVGIFAKYRIKHGRSAYGKPTLRK